MTRVVRDSAHWTRLTEPTSRSCRLPGSTAPEFLLKINWAVSKTPHLKSARLLYLAAEDNDVIALDADSGKEIWRFESQSQKGAPFLGMRGLGYYKQPETSGACAERILMNTQDARLIALERSPARPCQGFGSNGQVSLLTGMGEVTPGYYYVTSAPTIVRGRVVLGGWIADNQYWG